jgi:hypothetical protein
MTLHWVLVRPVATEACETYKVRVESRLSRSSFGAVQDKGHSRRRYILNYIHYMTSQIWLNVLILADESGQGMSRMNNNRTSKRIFTLRLEGKRGI